MANKTKSVVYFFVRRNRTTLQTELLLTLRNGDTDKLPWRYTLPTETIEPGEAPSVTIRRGGKEEFGENFIHHLPNPLYLGLSPKANHYVLWEVPMDAPLPVMNPTEGASCEYFSLRRIEQLMRNGEVGGERQLAGALTTFVWNNWDKFKIMFERRTILTDLFEREVILV